MIRLIFAFSLISINFVPSFSQDTTKVNSVVWKIYDGDSYFVFGMAKALRLACVDAPEVKSIYVTKAQPMGYEIGDSVRSYLKGREVVYQFVKTDKYKRPICRVFVDGTDFAEILLARGWAWYFAERKIPKSVRDRYKKLSNDAKKQKLGIFADPKAINPAKWRQMYPAD